jgi:membrane fusion protein (multidrug efflux system)
MESVATVTELKKPDEPNKKRPPIIMIGIVCCSLAFGLGLIFYWYIYSLTRIATDDAYVEAEISPVNSRIMGFVSEVPVDEAQEVRKGDLLLVLDDSDVKIELKLKKSRAEKARRDSERAASLKHSKAISKSDYENALAMYAAAEADYEGAQLKDKFTKVLAPADGVIAKRSVEVGQFVQPGQSLFVLIPKGEPWIKANYKETQLQSVKIGQPVKVKVDAYPGRVWMGKVEKIFPSTGSRLSLLPPENSTGNFTKVVQRVPVRISLGKDAEEFLKAGMSVETTIIAEP